MADHGKTDFVQAFNRVLAARKDLLRSKNNWRVLSGIPKTTALGAFAGKNPTIDTLEKLAAAAQMTVAELMAYGDPDWQTKVALFERFKGWKPNEIADLVKLLERRAEPPAPGASEASVPQQP